MMSASCWPQRVSKLSLAFMFLVAFGCHNENAAADATSTNTDIAPTGYKITKNKVVYQGWRTICEQRVKTPTQKEVTYDIVGQGGITSAVTVFAWDSRTKTATLIREYHPGPHEMLVGCAAGLVENKHSSIERAAQDELEEECHLHKGRWILLSKPIAMDKYTSTRIGAYLVVDPVLNLDPKPCDHEEDIEIIRNVTPEQIMELMSEGKMNVVGSWVCLLALDKLEELGEI